MVYLKFPMGRYVASIVHVLSSQSLSVQLSANMHEQKVCRKTISVHNRISNLKT